MSIHIQINPANLHGNQIQAIWGDNKTPPPNKIECIYSWKYLTFTTTKYLAMLIRAVHFSQGSYEFILWNFTWRSVFTEQINTQLYLPCVLLASCQKNYAFVKQSCRTHVARS